MPQSYASFTGIAALLPASITGRADYAALVEEAEFDVFDHYRATDRGHRHTDRQGWLGNPSTSPYGHHTVALSYYHADPEQVDTADSTTGSQAQAFLDAVKWTLVDLIRHRAQVQGTDGSDARMIQSEGRGRRSVSYAKAAQSATPAGLWRRLNRFTTSPPVFCA